MFYAFIKILFGSAIRIFFRRIVISGEGNIPADKPVILVANHPSAFMDPLLLGIIYKKPLYFFARADIFKPGFVNWITKKAHVSPIYRIVDGADTLEKNDEVFSNAYQLLAEKKTLLLFGEGFTDEIFIRRVKPMKKGSMRIALGAEKKFDFKLDVQIICVGINYADPNKFRSDVLIKFSKPISVNKYKDLFLEHNNKAMQELNKEIYSLLKNEVVHIENAAHSELLEQLLVVSGKGLNHASFHNDLSLMQRCDFSKKLSDSLNKIPFSESEKLREKCRNYFHSLNDLKISDQSLEKENSFLGEALFLILTFPLFLFGIVNNFPPIKLSAVVSKKISQRPVFWRSTDMAFSIITLPLYYLILLYFLNFFFQIKFLFLFVYLILMLPSGIFAFHYIKKIQQIRQQISFRKILKKEKNKVEALLEQRKKILKEIESLID